MFQNRPARNLRATQLPEVTRPETLGNVPQEAYRIRELVERKLISEAEGSDVNLNNQPQMREMIETLFNQVLADENMLFARAVRSQILDWVLADILGFGPLEPLLSVNWITEVMVNGHSTVYVERHGKIERSNVVFENNEPVNVPPVLAPIADMMVNEGSLLLFTNSGVASPSTDILITDFETFADGTANGTVLFRQPTFSGSTSAFLDASPNTTSVTGTFPAGNGSAPVLRANWSWNTTANAWLRLTTSGAANLPNPVIDLTRKLVFDIYTDKDLKVAVGASETGNPVGTPIGSNGGATGGIEFVGVTNVASGQPQSVRTVTASNWTTLVFDLPNEPVRNFASGNGVLSSATGLGVLEHLAFVPAAGRTPRPRWVR